MNTPKPGIAPSAPTPPPEWTEERSREVLEYCENATEGPWEFRNGTSRQGDSIEILCAEIGHASDDEDPEYGEVLFGFGEFGESQISENWNFCKRSRTDLPAAVREIERLRAEAEELRKDRGRLVHALQLIALWPPSYPANQNIQRIRDHARSAIDATKELK